MMRETRLLRLGVAACAFALAGCATATDTVPVAAQGEQQVAPAQDAAVADEFMGGVVDTIPVFLSRDPFTPVVTPADSDVVPAGDEGGGDGTGTPAPAQDSGDGAQCGDACQGRRVSLVSVLTEDGQLVAEISVNNELFRLTPGQVFADVFRLESINGTCVTITYGDVTLNPLCVGDPPLLK